MSATAAPAQDRSDFRTVTTGGALVGLVTGVAVVLFVAASRTLAGGAAREGVEALLVVAAAVAVAFLPARWTAARSTDGIAGAAAGFFNPASKALVPQTVSAGGLQQANALISRCVPRAELIPGRQFRVYLFDSSNRNKDLAELNCLPQ